MHMLFTEEEKQWIYTDVFGWPIKKDCPANIRKSIKKKKYKVKNQEIIQAIKPK